MYRQSPGRNHRSKGVRIKNVLQICLLLAVCFWLIYQVKHSHDKKKEFDESDAKGALQRSSSDDPIRLGRKDIQSQGDGTVTMNENHDDPSDEEEAIGEEVDETKHEEDEPEDRKVEAKEDDDEVDEHEEEKSDAEVDREHELDGEDKEDGDENETRETDPEDGRGEIEKESTAEDTDHDGDDKSTREEHYKADDASSAVTHDTQIVTTENENEHLETKADILHDSENGSFPNKTVLEGSNGTLTSNSTIENHDLTSENITESEIQLGHGPGNHTEDNNSVLNVDNTHSDSNSTGSVEFSDSSNNSTVSSSSEDTLISDASMEAGNNNTESSSENNNEVEVENSDPGDDGTDETMETTMIENPEEVQQDAIDESDTSHSMEKDVRTDLDTLPEIQTEGSNNDDAASE